MFDPRKFLEELTRVSKKILIKDGHLTPLCVILNGSKEFPELGMYPFVIKEDTDKDQICVSLTKMMKDFDAWGYAIIIESWSYTCKSEFLSIPSIPLSQHPDRKEVILSSIYTYDISYGMMIEFIRRNAKIYFKSPFKFEDHMLGRFAELLPKK
jgi:hypothetical protein